MIIKDNNETKDLTVGEKKIIAVFKDNKCYYNNLYLDEVVPFKKPILDIEYTVYLKRALTEGIWNSFCVPFDISEDKLKAAFGDNVKLSVFDGIENTTLKFKTANEVKAGLGYLLKPEVVNYDDRGYIRFSNTKIICEGDVDTTINNGTAHAKFTSCVVPARSFVISKNQWYHTVSDMNMKGYRVYLTISE